MAAITVRLHFFEKAQRMLIHSLVKSPKLCTSILRNSTKIRVELQKSTWVQLVGLYCYICFEEKLYDRNINRFTKMAIL